VLKDKRFWIGILVSLALLGLSVRGIDWPELWQALANAHWMWMGLALPLYLAGYWSRASRVSQILAPIKKVPTSHTLPPLVIGFCFNNILPGRLGEFVFAYLLGKREGISRSASLAAVVISRILDGFTILVFFLFGLFSFLHFGGGLNTQEINIMGMQITREALVGKIYLAGILGFIVFGLVMGVCFALILWKDFTIAAVDGILAIFPDRFTALGHKGKRVLEKFIAGLDILRDPKALVAVFLFNFLPWGLELFTYFFAAKTFGIDLNLRQCCLIMGMTNLAMILPSGPGGVGLFEYGGLMVMGLYGLEKTTALAYIVVVHALILLPIDVWGFFFMVREGITIQEALSEQKGGS
jgi:glycosyltransferase 2 family protein